MPAATAKPGGGGSNPFPKAGAGGGKCTDGAEHMVGIKQPTAGVKGTPHQRMKVRTYNGNLRCTKPLH